jgi:hypothetical protein
LKNNYSAIINHKKIVMDASVEIFEGYPDQIVAKIENRDRLRRSSLPSYIGNVGLELVFEDLKLWQAGVLTVSFKGGNPELHKKIADTVNEWTKYGNIHFDFGYNSSAKTFRQWSPADASHIRVGFEYAGYWSLVGTDSKDYNIAKDGDITLNLEGFDKQLPLSWAGTALHEFGHALGFHHEHQSPEANCDFDWDKLYEYLANSPNYWSRAKVDYNLKQLPAGGLTYSPHDKTSIMHYSFPAWMFKKAEASTCFTSRNNELSPMDKQMMGEAYPASRAIFEERTNTRISNLEKILNFSELKDDSTRSYFNRHLNFLKTDKQSLEMFK